MLPPYAKAAPRRGSALQRQDDANRRGAASVPCSSAPVAVPALDTFSPSFREGTSSIIKREYNAGSEAPAKRGGEGGSGARLALHSRRTAGVGGWQPGGGSGLGGGAGGGLLPGSPSGSENGGRQPSGAGRAGAAKPVLPLASGGPRAVHSALIPRFGRLANGTARVGL